MPNIENGFNKLDPSSIKPKEEKKEIEIPKDLIDKDGNIVDPGLNGKSFELEPDKFDKKYKKNETESNINIAINNLLIEIGLKNSEKYFNSLRESGQTPNQINEIKNKLFRHKDKVKILKKSGYDADEIIKTIEKL